MAEDDQMEEYIDAFMERLPKILEHYEGKWTVIGKHKVPLGFYETKEDALRVGFLEYGHVPMLLRQVSQEYVEYGRHGRPRVFHSRVGFAEEDRI